MDKYADGCCFAYVRKWLWKGGGEMAKWGPSALNSRMIIWGGVNNHHTLFNFSIYRSFQILSDVTNRQQAMDGVVIWLNNEHNYVLIKKQGTRSKWRIALPSFLQYLNISHCNWNQTFWKRTPLLNTIFKKATYQRHILLFVLKENRVLLSEITYTDKKNDTFYQQNMEQT